MAGTRADIAAAHARGAARGERDSFRQWVLEVTPVVHALALRITGDGTDAEDVVQETMVKAWQRFPELRDPQASLGWACAIARSTALDRTRANGRRRSEPLDTSDPDHARALEDGAPESHAEASIDRARARAAVRQAVDALGEKHRTALLLREADGLSNEQVAAALGIPLGTVESRLHRARHALATRLTAAAGRFGWRTT